MTLDAGLRTVVLDGGPVSIAELEAVARHGARVELGAQGRQRLTAARVALEGALEQGEVIYGVNTGFGSLARQRVSQDELKEVQRKKW